MIVHIQLICYPFKEIKSSLQVKVARGSTACETTYQKTNGSYRSIGFKGLFLNFVWEIRLCGYSVIRNRILNTALAINAY